ncbi:MAG: hypothetical protein HW383_487 [Candidatus Magasanikbacteria bacterium]|nr:hypothetical protein [Candidatus Magasanikbacteria bacterium]
MPTTKYRVNLSVSPNLKQTLQKLAMRDQTSVASKTIDLVRAAIEIEEDAMLLGLTEERESKKSKNLPHKVAWV